MKTFQIAALAPALASVLVLGACGGGGGGGSSAAPATPTGSVNVQITDGPGDEFQHVWVTVRAIAFHTSPDQVWSSADATWLTTTLPAPVTVDLTTLNNGVLNSTLFAGLNLPAGTYRQIRFFFDGAEAPLDASALATRDSNGAALQWNDQVEYLNGTSTPQESPLEIAYPTQGIQLVGTFNVAAGSTLNLAVDFDLEHMIVPFNHDGQTYFTLRPNLQYFDMTQVGAISGTVDHTQLCQSVGAELAQAPACAFNLVVKAELLSPDGSRHAVARETMVDPLTGNFTLYPLATRDASGNPIAAYDVVIRGRNMETMLVTGVPVTAGTSPGGTGSAAPTVLQAAAITPMLNTGEYTAQFAVPLAPLTSGYAIFQQTLPGAGAVPYEIRWRNTDPFTGRFRNPIPLQGASSALHVAAYNAGAALAFAGVVPQEGAGAYTVAANEAAYYRLGAGSVMAPPTAGSTQTFSVASPVLASGVTSGTVNVNLSFGGISADNNCEFVLARFAAIVDTYDCGPLLSTNGGPNSGAFTLSGVGAGLPGAYYYAYVRLWQGGKGMATRRIVPLDGLVDLRTQTTQTLNGSVPGA